MDPNEEHIVKLCKKNNRDGYRMLYDKYHRFVYAICYHSTYNEADALDLVQEVFIKVFNGMERFDSKRPILPWIKKITVNILINHTNRKLREEIIVDFSEDSPVGKLESSNVEDKPEESAAGHETRSAIEGCISQLPGNERTAIVLRHFEGKSYEEIALLMGCPLGSVKTYLHRGRKLLRDALVHKGIWEV